MHDTLRNLANFTSVPSYVGMKTSVEKRLDKAIRRYLEKNQLKYRVDGDGDFHLVAGFPDMAIKARLIILKEGENKEILSLVAKYDGLYFLSDAEALQKANEWNRSKRWPRVYWRDGHFYGDFHLDCEFGFSEKLVEGAIHRFLGGAMQFLMYLEEESKKRQKEIEHFHLGFTKPSDLPN